MNTSLTRPLSLERQMEVARHLGRDSAPGLTYFLLVVLSALIATLGLITNSAAVVIGAMLVAPLMSPILGLALASVRREPRDFRRATLALVAGVAIALVVSAGVAWLAQALPFGVLNELPSEVLARTRPTLFDVGIALAGGVAAAYALTRPGLSGVLPGAAIATALMPPLCVAGIGLAAGDPTVVFGAGSLFLINVAMILFAGIAVFRARGFRPMPLEMKWRHLSVGLIASVLLAVALPLVAVMALLPR